MTRGLLRQGFALALLVPASLAFSATPVMPVITNKSDVTSQALAVVSREAPDITGPVLAIVDLAEDGSARVRELRGERSGEPRIADVVRVLTESLRFDVPEAWLRVNPELTWGVVWAFHVNGCEPPQDNVPPQVTRIRVCMARKGAAPEGARSHLRFAHGHVADAGDSDGWDIVRTAAVAPGQSFGCDTQTMLRKPTARGDVRLAVAVDATGQATAVDVEKSSGSEAFDAALRRCFSIKQYVPATENDVPLAGVARVTYRWE